MIMEIPDPDQVERYIDSQTVELKNGHVRCLVCRKGLYSPNSVSRHKQRHVHIRNLAALNEQPSSKVQRLGDAITADEGGTSAGRVADQRASPQPHVGSPAGAADCSNSPQLFNLDYGAVSPAAGGQGLGWCDGIDAASNSGLNQPPGTNVDILERPGGFEPVVLQSDGSDSDGLPEPDSPPALFMVGCGKQCSSSDEEYVPRPDEHVPAVENAGIDGVLYDSEVLASQGSAEEVSSVASMCLTCTVHTRVRQLIIEIDI